jgi:4-hydroxy-tetrahydrodipicolinate synthase
MTFAGIRPVLHTPFSPPDVALADLERLTQRMAGAGASGLVALGLASEAGSLTEPERDACVRAVVAAAAGLPVTVGIDGDLDLALRRARRAAELGAQSVMVLTPPGRNLREHFAAVATAGLPVLVQDSPQVTGTTLTAADLLALRDAVPAIAAVKVEGPAAGPKISQLTAAGLAVVAGWGGLHYPEALRRGACGLMPGCDLAPAFVALHDRWLAGRRDAADALYDALLPYLAYAAQSLDLLILAAKRRLVAAGVFRHGALREPGAALDAIQADWLARCDRQLAASGVPGWAESPA